MPHRAAVVIVIASMCAVLHNADISWARSQTSATKTNTKRKAKPNLPGKNANLHSCRKPANRIAVRFKPGLRLKELLSWAMSFTCKNFIYSSRLGGRRTTMNIIAPKTVSARKAYRVFLMALQNMKLTIVRKGNFFEIVDAPRARGPKRTTPVSPSGPPRSL